MPDLITRLQQPASREAAFRELVRDYGPLLHRHLFRMLPGAADVDDVLQNTMVKAYRNLGSFRAESKLSTWLYRIATNEALTWLRSQQRRSKRTSSYDPVTLASVSPAADVYFDGDAAQAQLRAALEELPPKQRAVFCFRYFDDLPYQEIAAITGTSAGGLKASYHLAVKKITAKLQAYAN